MMPKKRAKTLSTLLLCLFLAGHACAQRFEQTIDPKTVKPTHQPGADVKLPPLDKLWIVGQHGDTVVLMFRRTIPSDRRALDAVEIAYRYTIGEETARVIHRRTSTGRSDQMPLGTDGVVAHSNGWHLLDGSGRRPDELNGFAAIHDQFTADKRKLMRSPIALPHGLLYQEAIKEDKRYKPGAIYYAPRDGLAYRIDQEVRIAEAGFGELGFNQDFHPGWRQGERYVVLFNDSGDKVSVLDLKTRAVRSFGLLPPEDSEQWGYSGVMMDDHHLYAKHGLYNLKTGERVTVRRERPGIKRIYKHPILMHNGVSYGVKEKSHYNADGRFVGSSYTLWARPVLDNGGRERVLAKTELHQTLGKLIAGQEGLIYTTDGRWVKKDWLAPKDFKQEQAKDEAR